MSKKEYESKKLYSKKYNQTQRTIQIDKELYGELKEFLKDKNISIRKYISSLIRSSIV
jgi:hypothetical protein